MAPADESVYLPPLAECLDGNSKLLSWKTIAFGLDGSVLAPLDQTIARHIEDSAAIQVLADCFTPPKSSTQSKAQFESLTAAINLTPTSDNRYDIKELKEDSLWLSQAAQIDEVQALRHTILEWQSRLGRQAVLSMEEVEMKDFNSAKNRRQRLLEIYFEEQQWLFRCVEIIVARGIYGLSKQQTTASSGNNIGTVAQALSKSWNINSSSAPSGDRSWLSSIRDYLQSQVNALQSGTDILSRDDMQDYVTESLYAICTETSIVQVIHGLQMVLLIQWSLPHPLPPNLVAEWFSWMDASTFFQSWLSYIPTPFAQHRSATTGLLIIGSLAFIDLAASYEILPDLATTSAANEGQDAKVYLQSLDCITQLNRILGNNIEANNEIVAPAAIAWCSLLNVIHTHATQSIEYRENRQAQKAIDSYGANQLSDNESLDGFATSRRISPNRRQSFGSDTSGQATLFEDIDEVARRHPMGEETIQYFGNLAAIQLDGFSVIENAAQTSLSRIDCDTCPELTACIREILIQFIKTCIDLEILGYSQSALDILFTILAQKDRYWKWRARKASLLHSSEAIHQPLGDDLLLSSLMASARGRFPHEGVPLVKLCRVLLPYQDFSSKDDDLILEVLSNMAGYTALVSEANIPYELVGEGENMQIHLQHSINALAMTFPNLLHNLSNSTLETLDSLMVSAGTIGQPLRDDKPIIALWNFKYSALRFYGLTLQLQLQWRTSPRQGGLFQDDYSSLYSLNTEIIALLATWIMEITSEGDGQESSEKARALLASVSDDLDRNQDIVAIILALLEGEIYRTQFDSSAAGFLFRCMQFLVALATVTPGRIWSFLSRSGLLGLHGQENRLTAIVTAAELPSGTYDILLSSLQLLDVLIDDSIRGTSSSKTNSLALKRFRAIDVDVDNSGAQATTVTKILDQFTKIMVDVFETSSSWNFKDQEDELSLRLGIYTVLQKIISYTFDYDDESMPEQKPSASIRLAADYLLENFLSESASDTLLVPLFKELIHIIVEPSTSLPSRSSILRQSVALSSLKFSTELVRLNKFLNKSTSNLTKKICGNISVFVNLFVSQGDLRLSVVRLLDAVIRDIASTSQPAPILGALTEPSAKAFMQSLIALGLSRTDSSLSAATWSLFSAAVTSNQQWFTVYLLSGKTPKESLKKTLASPLKPTIRLALTEIANIDNLPGEEALKLLEFVAYSANFWTSVTQELKNDKECRQACLKYLSGLQSPKKDRDIDVGVPVKLQMAAYIVNILALLVHQSNQQNDTTTLKHLIPSITYLVEHGASSPHYNASLHHGLQKNFEGLFNGSSLRHFKRTSFSQPQLGNEFYYDKALADTIFRQNQAWTGKTGKGYSNEFTRANINLSLVEAQVNLFHSWKSLAVELAEGLGNDSSFQTTMISIIKNCLDANQGSTMPEAIFKKLCTSRADLAFTLLQRLLDMKSEREELKGILPITWQLVQSHIADLGSTLVSEDADYVRLLLRLLYLSLCAHDNRSADTTSVENAFTAIALDVLQTVVAQGFRSLIGQLHENSDQVQSGDLVLIIAILRASLRLPGVTNHSERLLAHFADEKTIQHAGTLISWSEELAISGDPIYGELSMMFLLELSTVQVLAEAIMVNGTFSQISSTTLFSRFRRAGGFGPFDTPPRMYNIWSRGYLPLVLNVVGAIGAPVAVEIATTFVQFAPQLKRASLQFDPKPSTSANTRSTLSMINEAHSLALLNVVLNRFREAGSSLGIITADLPQLQWDASSVKEDLESLLGRRHTLRDSIVPGDEREDIWFQQKPHDAKEGAQSRLEERIIEEINATLALMGDNES